MAFNIKSALDLKALREWVAAKPEGEILGDVGQARSCPVANYLYEQSGCDYTVFPTWTSSDGEAYKYPSADLPLGVKLVVDRIDKLDDDYGVSREVLLGIIDRVAEIVESMMAGDERVKWGEGLDEKPPTY